MSRDDPRLGFLPGYRLLHRDLKPDNVGFASDGRAVLLDFGLCKLWQVSRRRDGPSDGRKMTGQTGSLRYMAPEVRPSADEGHTHSRSTHTGNRTRGRCVRSQGGKASPQT